MSGFNVIETKISNLLSYMPGAKSKIKKLYSIINYSIFKKKHTVKTDFSIEKILPEKNNESFFGYYDKSPVNLSEGMIFHSFSPSENTCCINLIKHDGTDSEVHTSTAFSLQQGSRLMWLTEDKFIYNDSENGKFISRIYDTDTWSTETINMPVYDCFKDKFALSVNFSRLKATDSDYGYGDQVALDDLPGYNEDGIFYIDLQNNSSKLLLSFVNVLKLYKDLPENARYCFNHIMISPDGKNFIFIHRWYISGKRSEALLVSDFSGNVRMLSNNGFVSHCCWFDNETVVGYLYDPSYGNSFYKINISTANIELLSDKLKSFGDGHPSVFENKMLFDSYPDRSRMQHLYIFDMLKDEVDEIGSFLSPLKYFGSNRCDLHPRWSPDGKSVYFDSVHEGKRGLYKLKLNDKK